MSTQVVPGMKKAITVNYVCPDATVYDIHGNCYFLNSRYTWASLEKEFPAGSIVVLEALNKFEIGNRGVEACRWWKLVREAS